MVSSSISGVSRAPRLRNGSKKRVLPKSRKTPQPSSAEARRRMQSTRQTGTSCELALRSALRAKGLRFRVDWPIPGTRRRADIVFIRARVVIFVDGCFWHACPHHATWPKNNAAWWRAKIDGNVERDRSTDKYLRESGWTVVRFWEHAASRAAARRIEVTLLNQAARLQA